MKTPNKPATIGGVRTGLAFVLIYASFIICSSRALAQTTPTTSQLMQLRQLTQFNKPAPTTGQGVTTLAASLSVQQADSVNNPLSQIIQSLVGPGVTVSNIQTTLPQTSNIYGSFTGGLADIGIDKGLIMTSGSIFNILGPNISPSTSQDNGLPGYLAIDTAGFDACVISFDVTSATTFLSFKYVFASEEYNEYVGSVFNDDFAFLISGPGIPAGTNIALIPGTVHPVDINDINLGLNAQYYINNDSVQNADPVRFQNLEYDGLTKVLVTSAISVVPGATYTLTLIIQDVADAVYDSGVFLEGGSITSDSCVLTMDVEKQDISCNGASDGSIELEFNGANGQAQILWSTGDTTAEIENLAAGTYNVTVTDEKGCTETLPTPVIMNEPAALDLSQPVITSPSCIGGGNGSVIVGVTGGTAPYQYTVDNVTNNSGFFTDLPAGSYNYSVSDAHSCTTTGSFIIPQEGSCDDGNSCTVDACDNGQCISTPISCDDGNACTVDGCTDGACIHSALVCNDNNSCTNDNCENGQCIYTSISCDDGIACTIDGCNNGCAHTPIVCNDNIACTTDGCVEGNCIFTPISCEDNNGCTIDGCNNGICIHNDTCNACGLAISSFSLVNSTTDLDIGPIDNGSIINLFYTPDINVRANPCSLPVGSVKFILNNTTKIENSAPYALAGDNNGNYKRWNVSVGTYTLTAIPHVGTGASGTQGTSKTVTFYVINQQLCQSNADCNDNVPCTNDVCVNGSCTHTIINASSYLHVVNMTTSWRKLKLGYSPTNLFNPPQNVIAGGNTMLCVTLRGNPGTDWSKILIRPQGSISIPVSLGSYGLGTSFQEICIPVAAFGASVDFSKLTLIEIPYSNGAGPFEIDIQRIEFRGGITPFLWFGDSKTNNKHDGNTPGALAASLIQNTPCGVSKTSTDEVSLEKEADQPILLNAYPNPFSDEVKVEFTMPQDARVLAKIVDVNGKLINLIYDGDAKGGETYVQNVHTAHLSPGMYFYRLISENGEIHNMKLILFK